MLTYEPLVEGLERSLPRGRAPSTEIPRYILTPLRSPTASPGIPNPTHLPSFR